MGETNIRIFIGGQFVLRASVIYWPQKGRAVKRCLDGSCPDKGAGRVPKEPEIANPTSSHSSTPSLGAAARIVICSIFHSLVKSISTAVFVYFDFADLFCRWFQSMLHLVLTMLLAITLHSGSAQEDHHHRPWSISWSPHSFMPCLWSAFLPCSR